MKKISIYDLSELIVMAGLIAVCGVLLIDVWRKSWMTPVAGLILGVIFGYTTILTGHTEWTPLTTLFGAIAGPNIVVMLHGKEFKTIILDTLRKRLGGGPLPGERNRNEDGDEIDEEYFNRRDR